jgi:hypothetical protein
MNLILGMDPLVFIAWILTIISAIICILYGIYYEFLKKQPKQKNNKKTETEGK